MIVAFGHNTLDESLRIVQESRILATLISDVKAGGFALGEFSLLVLEQMPNAQTWQFTPLS
jgi:hypothetical protein